jgi:hypothetical protein
MTRANYRLKRATSQTDPLRTRTTASRRCSSVAGMEEEIDRDQEADNWTRWARTPGQEATDLRQFTKTRCTPRAELHCGYCSVMVKDSNSWPW